MTAEVRALREEDFEAWEHALATGFLRTPEPEAASWRRRRIDLGRTRGAFDGGRVVGTFRSFASELTLPGGAQVAVGAVTNVTVTATHRRLGLLSRMMEADLRDTAERGEAAAILIASEFPIYGRYGYGAATERVTWELDAAARFVQPGEGDLQLVDAATARREMPAVFERRRRREAGQIPISEWRWDAITGIDPMPGLKEPHRWFLLARGGGETHGFLVYHLEEKWEGDRPGYTVHVDGLFGDTPDVEARLWRYCCEMDWVGKVRAETRSVGDALPWLLTDARMAAQKDRTDHLWLRPLDVPGLLSARPYAAAGTVTLEVHDPAGFAAGTFTVQGGPDGATCRAGGEADVALGASALGAALLGGQPLEVLARGGLVEERRPGGLRRAATMLGWPDPPFCAIWF